ncbi:MAG: mechanosensitive ion channel family protein [Flavisolibacter sp.]
MKRFLDQEFFNNTIRDYVWVAGVILLVLILNRIISKYIAILLSKVFRRAWKTFDQTKFVELIINPLGIFLVISVSLVALYRLSFPPELNITLYKFSLQLILISIAKTIQVIAFIWLMLRIIDFIATILEARANKTPDLSDNQLIVFFRDFLKVVIGLIGVMMIMHFGFGYHIGSLLTGLSIVGAAIALALRESLENLIASFVIFFDKPFTTGDLVRVQSVTGNVERIGLRSTRIRTTDKSYVTVPNKQMVDSILDNSSLRSQLRGELTLFVSLKTGPEKIRQLIEAIKKNLSTVEEISASSVLFNDIRMQGYIVFIEYFTPPIDNNLFVSIRQQLNFFVLQKMEEMQISISEETKLR